MALPEIYSFPPFFTCVVVVSRGSRRELMAVRGRLQPNDAVRAKQLQEWRNLIVAWHEARKETTMVVADWPLWENKAIGRASDIELVVSGWLVNRGICLRGRPPGCHGSGGCDAVPG